MIILIIKLVLIKIFMIIIIIIIIMIRGHNLKLKIGKIRCGATKNFFGNRVVRPWKSLPVDIINSSSVSRFNSAIRELNLNQYLS